MTIEEILDIVKEEIINTKNSLTTAIEKDNQEEQKRYNNRIIEYVGFLNYLYREMEED